MPLNRINQRSFHRRLYAGMLESIKILKRGPNQQGGTITTYILHECRRSQIRRTGEIRDGEQTMDHTTTWHIPVTELDRVGLTYLAAADRIVQLGTLNPIEVNWTWEPESDTTITTKLWGIHFCIDCKRTDPPIAAGGGVG